MRRYVLLIFLLCVVSMAHAYTGFGICNFGKESVPAVICYGPAVLKDTTIENDVKVAGPLNAMNVLAGSLTITGSAELQDTTIKGEVTITGSLNAHGARFEKGLNIISDKIFLYQTKIKGPVRISSQKNFPYLIMECGSIINGPVIFDGKAGVIQITDDSVVQGKITNGSMEFIKKLCKDLK